MSSNTVRKVTFWDPAYCPIPRVHRQTSKHSQTFQKEAEVEINWWDESKKRFVPRKIYTTRARAEQFVRNGH